MSSFVEKSAQGDHENVSRTCRECRLGKQDAEFYKAAGNTDGISRLCIDCHKAQNDKRYVRNAEQVKAAALRRYQAGPEKIREKHLLSYYKLSMVQYQSMIAAQSSCCAICLSPFLSEKRKGPFVDHDHSCCPGIKCCGKCVRGLICRNCNTVLGHAKDRTDVLYKAIQYLETYPKREKETFARAETSCFEPAA